MVSARASASRRAAASIFHVVAFATLVAPALGPYAVLTRKEARPDPIAELLGKPASPPEDGDDQRWDEPPETGAGDEGQRNVPPDNAPIADLVRYWSIRADFHSDERPPETTLRRLLEECDRRPPLLRSIVPVLPDSPAVVNAVLRIYERREAARTTSLTDLWLKDVRDWLMHRCTKFLPDLEKAAAAARETGESVEGERALQSLARLDPARALPILEAGARGTRRLIGALALRLLYEQADRAQAPAVESLRARLQAIAADRGAPLYARAQALTGLLGTAWTGRDAWYLSLLSDRSLEDLVRDSGDGGSMSKLVLADPELWVPRVAALVFNENKRVHDMAVALLSQFCCGRTRADALRPLIPWLSNPRWSSAPDTYRAWLIQGFQHVVVPEAIEPLLALAGQTSGRELGWAALALAAHGEKRAIPILERRAALALTLPDRRPVVGALLRLGALSTDERAWAIECHAAAVAHELRPHGAALAREWPVQQRAIPPDAAASIGDVLHEMYAGRPRPRSWSPPHLWFLGLDGCGATLSGLTADRETLASRLLARSAQLAGSQSKVARSIERLLDAWPARAVDEHLLASIRDGYASGEQLAAAVDRRSRLRRLHSRGLSRLASEPGWVGGIGAALLGDAAVQGRILCGRDAAAQRALIVALRLTWDALDVPSLLALHTRGNLPVREAVDSFLLARHGLTAVAMARPGTITVLGVRPEPVGLKEGITIARREEQWRVSMEREPAIDELFALISAYGATIVLVRGTHAELVIQDDGARQRRGALPMDRVRLLRDFVAREKFDDLPPCVTRHSLAGYEAEYIHLRRVGGRRVYIRYPKSCIVSDEPPTVYDRMIELFATLRESGQWRVEYRLEDGSAPVEVVLARSEEAYAWPPDDREPRLSHVWKKGADLRVRTERPDGNRGVWRSVLNGRLGVAVPEPADCPVDGGMDWGAGSSVIAGDSRFYTWKARRGDETFRASGAGALEGLWSCRPGRASRRIRSGTVSTPVVTPDGRWLFFDEPVPGKHPPLEGLYRVMRMNLSTEVVERVGVPDAQVMSVVKYLRHPGAVLVGRRERFSLPEGPVDFPTLMVDHEWRVDAWYLVEPATLAVRRVTGTLSPWLHETYRPLQPTGRPDEAWTAIYRRDRNVTEVGRYDTRGFSFMPVAAFAGLAFDSMAMWVDEAKGKIYLVWSGDLIRLPLHRGP